MERFEQPQMTIYELDPELNLCASGGGMGGIGGGGAGGGSMSGSGVGGSSGGFD